MNNHDLAIKGVDFEYIFIFVSYIHTKCTDKALVEIPYKKQWLMLGSIKTFLVVSIVRFFPPNNAVILSLWLGPVGEMLDNMMGGNPNPTLGQVYGGAPGVGGYPQYPQYGGYRPY